MFGLTRTPSLADDIASRNATKRAHDAYKVIMDEYGPDLTESMREDVIQQFSQLIFDPARLHQLSNELAGRADALERGDVVERVRRAGE